MTTTQQVKLEMPAKRLLELSQDRFYNAYSAINWPEQLNESGMFMSEPLISIIGTDLYAELDATARWRLSFYELVNFFSMNVNGERDLIAELARRLHSPATTTYAPYLHALIDEENKHMYMFSNFCLRYCGKIYASKKINFPSVTRPELEDLMFFTRVLIFEEIVDYYNAWMKDDPNLAPFVREINRIHHDDEVSHLVFGRDRIKRSIADLKENVKPEEMLQLRQYFSTYLQTTLRDFYNPEVYRDAGLPEPYALRRLALATPERQAVHSNATNRCRKFLGKLGLLPFELE